MRRSAVWLSVVAGLTWGASGAGAAPRLSLHEGHAVFGIVLQAQPASRTFTFACIRTGRLSRARGYTWTPTQPSRVTITLAKGAPLFEQPTCATPARALGLAHLRPGCAVTLSTRARIVGPKATATAVELMYWRSRMRFEDWVPVCKVAAIRGLQAVLDAQPERERLVLTQARKSGRQAAIKAVEVWLGVEQPEPVTAPDRPAGDAPAAGESTQ